MLDDASTKMVDPPIAAVSESGEPSVAPVQTEAPARLLRVPEEQADRIFFGPNGLRALWRLLLFLAMQSLAATVIALLRRLGPAWLASPATTVSVLTPQYFLITEPIAFAGYFLGTCAMGRIEGRTLANYGLAVRGFLQSRFWLGLAAGFAAVSTLLGAMRLAGVLHFDGVALHGTEAWTYAGVWAAAFLLVSLQEEFRGRGYELFTLATGVGFWPAALLTSFWFGYTHRGNSGETPIGLLSVGAIGLFFCIVVRKTGDLLPAMGFHAAWDFGLTYVYGAPDSGLAEVGHLLNSRSSGPVWLTGGSAGPEASLLCLILIIALSAAMLTFFPQAKYPVPAAVRDPRRRELNSQARSSS